MRPFSEGPSGGSFSSGPAILHVDSIERSFRYRSRRTSTGRYCVDSILVVRPSERLNQPTSRFVGRAAWVSSLDPANAFRKLFLPGAPGPQWSIDPDGSSALVLESELYTQDRVDPIHSDRSTLR